jgi:ABC-type Mn2+/Zn2+ transport system ATPase subunit
MISSAWSYAKKIAQKQNVGIPKIYLLIIILFLDNVLMALILSELMVAISSGNREMIKYCITLKIFSKFLNDFVITYLIVAISNDIRIEYTEDQIRKYSTLRFDDRPKKTGPGFYDILEKSSHSIFLIIDWGLTQITSLIGSIIAVVYTCSQKGLIPHLIFAFCVIGCIYYIVIKPQQNKFTATDKKFKKFRNALMEKIAMDLIPFQYKEYEPEHIIKLRNNLIRGFSIIENKWHMLAGITSSSNHFLAMGICYATSDNVIDFMLIFITMGQLTNTISQLTGFLAQYNRIRNDFDNMDDFWKDCLFEDEPEKLPFRNNRIVNFHVKQGKIDLKLDSDFGEWVMWPGMKMLLSGPTGHGKTTLKKALFGLIESDMKFEYGKPKNFYHTVADYFQEIKEKTPSSKTSLRDYFKEEESNEVIEEYLRLAWGKKYNDIVSSIGKNESDNVDENDEFAVIKMHKNHPFDKPLNEILSGGEKSRLILWTRGYEVDKKGKTIIVLDEPCPDVDHDTYLDTLNTFFDKYRKCMIIMIGHLCDCKRKGLNIKWDMEIKVENNIVCNLSK